VTWEEIKKELTEIKECLVIFTAVEKIDEKGLVERLQALIAKRTINSTPTNLIPCLLIFIIQSLLVTLNS